ncbi:uncharacterized protein LOC119651940 isoform X2 [Hermetia illucens]|uniref:uncharacterized protein LOC119651940 isoform X2 n=1 Tax=Hermetia illucens TaxID=343691 RepID=UPI0018CBFF14|nr:uncharacterized protein LOC119651940 isoform X2 [Hermetia illucens]
MNVEDIKLERARQRRRSLYRFRAIVRLVILNRHWLEEMEDQKLGPNIKRNIALITRRKGNKGILSITEKSILKKEPENRTPAERRRLVIAISSLKCFARYPPRVRSRLARVCFYLFFEAGKVIVKEGHPPGAMYFILDGEIAVTKMQLDTETKEYVDSPVGMMQPGDTFGEVALLDKSERTATCTASTNVELLCIFSSDFDKILRETLKSQWDQIVTAVSRFDVFKDWTKAQIRECCILSKIKEYDPHQMVYYEDKGLLNFVHFILSGQCTILQCLKVQAQRVEKNEKRYTLSNLVLKKSDSHEIMEQINQTAKDYYTRTQSGGVANEIRRFDLEHVFQPSAPVPSKKGSLRISTNIPVEELYDTRLLSKVNDQLITDLFETNEEEQLKNEVIEYHFIEVGTLTCGAIFGLGERMEHRMIMAKSTVQCLLIPRFWLLQKAQNIANIWRRTEMYLETIIPSRDVLFENFKASRKWRKYKKSLINSLVEQKPSVNTTKIEDIPIICRIVEAD